MFTNSLKLFALLLCLFFITAFAGSAMAVPNILHGDSIPAVTKKPILKTFAGDCTAVDWATWNTFTGTTAMGTVNTLTGPVDVTMTANFDFNSSPEIFNYPKFSGYPSPIPNTTVPNTSWAAGPGGVTTMCFARKVTNPVLLISSLGSNAGAGVTSTLTFSLPYVVLYDGGGNTFVNSTTITATEGYAIIMFPGDFTCVSIFCNTPEYYSNLTWGLRPQPFPISFTDDSAVCGATTVTANGGVSYHWDGGDTPNSQTNTFHTSGTYIVSVTNADGCTTSASKDIVVKDISQQYVAGNPTDCNKVTLTANGGDTYLWDGGQTPNNATNTFTTSGSYSVVIEKADGCRNVVSLNVTVNPVYTPAVTIKATPDVAVCEGTAVSFEAIGTDEGPAPAYQWFVNNIAVNTGKTFSTDVLKNGDIVTCRLTNSAACATPATAFSNVFTAMIDPVPQISFNQNLIITDANPIVLQPQVTTAVATYEWTPSAGLSATNIANPVASPEVTTTYHLKVTSTAGCEANADIIVTIARQVVIPNTFTPNGDGYNDLWNIRYLTDYPNADVKVFDRRGLLIYHSLNSSKPWDGNFTGKPVPAGVYYYMIDLELKAKTKPIAGSLTVLR